MATQHGKELVSTGGDTKKNPPACNKSKNNPLPIELVPRQTAGFPEVETGIYSKKVITTTIRETTIRSVVETMQPCSSTAVETGDVRNADEDKRVKMNKIMAVVKKVTMILEPVAKLIAAVIEIIHNWKGLSS